MRPVDTLDFFSAATTGYHDIQEQSIRLRSFTLSACFFYYIFHLPCMDHVPYPKNAAVPKIEIPYICGEYADYDNGGFLNYPVRRGWAESAETSQWMDCSVENIMKRTQNWLFFGLLHEILGLEYHKESFLRQNPHADGLIVDTTTLPECLANWTRSIQRLQRSGTATEGFESDKFFDDLDVIFVEVDCQCERVDRLYWESRWITLSVKILLQSVQQAASNVDYRLASKMYLGRVPPARISLLNTSSKTWCSGQATRLCARFSVIMYNYLAALPRHVVNLDHEQCSLDKCIANNVDFATYNTRHVSNRCQCRFSGPDITKVSELISEGSVPLVALAFNLDGSPHFEIIKAEPGIEYTAISHVWVGGLGNFSANELPQCQLERLSNLIKQLNATQVGNLFPGLRSFTKSIPPLSRLLFFRRQVYRPPFKRPERSSSYFHGGFSSLLKRHRNRQSQRAIFWMDTLLIPVGEANASLRNKAIQSMALIYARAKNVLVLDAELQNISLQGIPLEQASAHVLSSSWMTRCWTLQEACLSGNWVVQFKDGIFDPYVAKERAYSVRQKATKTSTWNDEVEIIQESISWYDEMPGLRLLSVFSKSQYSELTNFVNTWNHLMERSTSKAEDLHVIFANMLDLPVSEILKLSYNQRMKAILSSQSLLPLALLYTSGIKIDDIRNRWVPLNIGGSYMIESRGELTATAEGLLFTGGYYDHVFVGLLVHSSVPRLAKFRVIDPLKSETIWVRHRDGTDPNFQVPGRVETLYLMDGLDEDTHAEKHQGEHLGAQLAVMGREGHLLRLRYECSFSYGFSRPQRRSKQLDFVYDNDEFPFITGTRTTKDQSFLLECG